MPDRCRAMDRCPSAAAAASASGCCVHGLVVSEYPGDEPISQRLDDVVVLLLDGFRRCATDGDDRTLDRAIGI